MIKHLTGLEKVLVATGGGAILKKANRQRLAGTGIVVYLKTSVDEQLRRTRRSRTRPLLLHADPRSVLEQMSTKRSVLYEALADITIDTSGQRVKAVAKELKAELERQGALPLQK
jgi:shikimate kinase